MYKLLYTKQAQKDAKSFLRQIKVIFDNVESWIQGMKDYYLNPTESFLDDTLEYWKWK